MCVCVCLYVCDCACEIVCVCFCVSVCVSVCLCVCLAAGASYYMPPLFVSIVEYFLYLNPCDKSITRYEPLEAGEREN